MIMCRELTEAEILNVVAETYIAICLDDALVFAKALFEAARVQQTQERE